MLKCQNVNAIGKLPCDSKVHVTCIQSLESGILPFLATFFCAKCCSANTNIKEEMVKIAAEARQALAKSQISLPNPPKENDEIQKLQITIKNLQSQLATTAKQLQAQLVLNDNVQKRFENLEVERNELKEKVLKSQSCLDTHLKRSFSEPDNDNNDQGILDSLLTDSTATILTAAQLNQQAEEHQRRMNAMLNSSSA
ncbi:hypothetical protein ACKWTF_007557 [Chironomus riparius]